MLGYMIAGWTMDMTVILMMARTNLRRWLGYANVVDIGFTLCIIALFHSTFSGIVAASFAGVFMSVLLWVLRSSIGCERLKLRAGRFWIPRLQWVVIPAAECRKGFFKFGRTVAAT